MWRHKNKNKYVSNESLDDLKYLVDNVKRIKSNFRLKDDDIAKLLNKWYTFSEIEQWWFNDRGVFIPKDIIMQKTKEYLLMNNFHNTYANQW